VLTIDALSPEIALAKVHVRIHEKRFVDNLNLLKLEGSWRIVAKIYCHVGVVPLRPKFPVAVIPR
jgi:hypothetical protein